MKNPAPADSGAGFHVVLFFRRGFRFTGIFPGLRVFRSLRTFLVFIIRNDDGDVLDGFAVSAS